MAKAEVALDSLADAKIPVHVFVPASAFEAGTKTQLSVTCTEPDREFTRVATLLGPGARRR